MTDANHKIEVLRDILVREQSADYSNLTVIGGLDQFLLRWADELSLSVNIAVTYSAMSVSQRRDWVSQTIVSMDDIKALQAEVPYQEPESHLSKQTSVPRHSPSLPLDTVVSQIKGVTKTNHPKLDRLGVKTVEDLVYLFPHRHKDFTQIRKISQLQYGEEQTIEASVFEAKENRSGPRRNSTHAVLVDDTGTVRTTWFNQGYLAKSFKPGTKMVVSGKVSAFRGSPVFENPEYEIIRGQDDLTHAARLVPVYPLVEGLYQRTVRRIVKAGLDAGLNQVVDHLPQEVVGRTGLQDLTTALSQIHYPDSGANWESARRRLAFDELFMMQLSMLRRKQSWQEMETGVQLPQQDRVNTFLKSLPFELTLAQKRVIEEITRDITSDRPMGRLLQGDVGSGKTVVAVASMLGAVMNGYQAALLAPTEILAEQHFFTITHMLSDRRAVGEGTHLTTAKVDGRDVIVGLLLGSLKKRDKDQLRMMIEESQVDVVIGTHAIIQKEVEIPKLAVAVVDEQHRFGVMQRAALREKGIRPHLLAMSATPIPRSLALTLYGELDVSFIDEMPAGRQSIKTRYVDPIKRTTAYDFVRDEVSKGRQAFFVMPFVDESEIKIGKGKDGDDGTEQLPGIDPTKTKLVKGAVDEFERLSTSVFPDLRLGLLHGRMSLKEKELVMAEYQNGEIDILVSTPVIEVGIDVPNATVMLIDGADRFGLAQLHQFRGRVGRGEHQSYCLLLADDPSKDARERLKLVERINDGFRLAEEDLRIRGPGDYLGTRQSGLPNLKLARITDQDIVSLARREATRILEHDPDLQDNQYQELSKRLSVYEADLAVEMS